ncbi:MAG: hypothetical protein COA42_20445 [Alteromonadaceae bacterium]|nr:MAG: hypothetical protein COA42_20445 [Alteromonadaceae bacterium]
MIPTSSLEKSPMVLQCNLLLHLINEVEAMIVWALTNGRDVPSAIVERFYDILNEVPPDAASMANKKASSVLDDCDQERLRGFTGDLSDLVDIHRVLRLIIMPAKPRTVTLMFREQHRKSLLMFLGPVPLIRQLVTMAVVFLAVLYTLGQLSVVNIESINRSILNSEGTNQLFNQGFLLACAGLGSVFSCLFQSMSYVTKGTYDPKYNVSYWVRIILGLMSGLILVEMIPDEILRQGVMEEFGKPTIALLGGFSATVVHKLLQKIVDILSNVIDQIPGSKRQPDPGNSSAAAGAEVYAAPSVEGGDHPANIAQHINEAANKIAQRARQRIEEREPRAVQSDVAETSPLDLSTEAAVTSPQADIAAASGVDLPKTGAKISLRRS